MTTHSSTHAWGIPWTEKPGGLQSTASQSRTRLKQLSTHAHIKKYLSPGSDRGRKDSTQRKWISEPTVITTCILSALNLEGKVFSGYFSNRTPYTKTFTLHIFEIEDKFRK